MCFKQFIEEHYRWLPYPCLDSFLLDPRTIRLGNGTSTVGWTLLYLLPMTNSLKGLVPDQPDKDS